MARNYKQEGDTLTLTPAAAVAVGEGYLFGAALFGVAMASVAANAAGQFATEGVWELAKTSALAISIGDRLFWDAANKCVNKTAAGQACVGIAVSVAANPSATVLVKLEASTPVGT
jgi:predicted RecA/RadA family phage recombinase